MYFIYGFTPYARHITDIANGWQNLFLLSLDPALDSFLVFALGDDYLLNIFTCLEIYYQSYRSNLLLLQKDLC